MHIARSAFRLALPVGVLLYCLHGALAEESEEVRQACTPDAMRLCSEFIPDKAKITHCMMAKRRQLSAECLTAMRKGSHHRHVARYRRARVHCRSSDYHCGD